MFGNLFGFSFNLCARCLSNKEKPTLATPALVTAFLDKSIQEKAKEAGKDHFCPNCEAFLEKDEVLDRDEIIQLILMSLEPEKVRAATIKVVESKKQLREEAKKELAERTRQREEKRAQEEADGVEYERRGIFGERVRKEKPDETT